MKAREFLARKKQPVGGELTLGFAADAQEKLAKRLP